MCRKVYVYRSPVELEVLDGEERTVYAEATSLILYKDNNSEDDAGTFTEHAKAKLDSAVQQFSFLKKLLKAEELTTKPDENVPGSVADVD